MLAVTGQSQSEVNEICRGYRQVLAYDLLVRIADGLGIPRGHMGLEYSPDCKLTPMVEDGAASEQDDEEMKRRNLIKHGGAVMFGLAVFGEPEPIQAVIEPTPLWSQLGMADVARLEAATAKLRILDRQYGGRGILDAVQAQYQLGNHLMKAASNDHVCRQIAAALADHGSLAGFRIWSHFADHRRHVRGKIEVDIRRAYTLGLDSFAETRDAQIPIDELIH